MTNTADLIKNLILEHTARIHGNDIGTITGVRAPDRVSVKLKHLIDGQVREYNDVPVLPIGSGSGRITAWPVVGDTVVLAYMQYDIWPQLEQVGAITDINTGPQYLNPIVLTIIDTNDSVPETPVREGELLLQHASGSYIRFRQDGSIIIAANSVNIIQPGDPE